MATKRATVQRRPAVSSPSTSTVVSAAAGGVKATPPPAVSGDGIEDDDLCDCGQPASRHPGLGVSRFPASGCVGFKPR